MLFLRNSRTTGRVIAASLATLALVLATAGFGFASAPVVSKPFSGSKVNGGTVTADKKGAAITLTLSADFKVPDTPDPHWQVVDSKGTVYPLQKLAIKGDKVNTSITLPSYVQDVAKVQIWCAWAEALLGEAPFDAPVR